MSFSRSTSNQIGSQTYMLTFCFSCSVLASIRTFAQGNSLGHQTGRVDSLPQPGFPRPERNLQKIMNKNRMQNKFSEINPD